MFTALAISREVQNRTELSIRRVLRTLKPLRSATVQVNGTAMTIAPALSPHEQELIDALASPAPRH